MISREKRLDIIKVLKTKKALIEKLNHNKNEVKMIEGMADAETNAENLELLQRSIRKGAALVSTQTTQLAALSASKIGRIFKVPETSVNYQWKLLTGAKL